MKNSPVEVARSQFAETFETSDTPTVALAPGRVNLIGEHTDYNDGFVLPMAIDRGVAVAFAQRNDGLLRAHSVDFGETRTAEISKLQPRGVAEWFDYVAAVVWVMRDEGMKPSGLDMVVAGDIPVGAGLSSSAALELAIAHAFWAISRWDWNPTKMALLAQKTENDWMGLQTGIMDQMVCANGKKGHALLIDCRDLTSHLLPLPDETTVVVLDTATRRGLVDSAYNERVRQCKTASDFFGVISLRDLSLANFEAQADELNALIHRRARHVITENARTLQAAEAMQAGDAHKLGELMNASHLSLRDDYEVSSIELNIIVEVASAQPGCLGARMTGAGFGGCAVALIKNSNLSSFTDEIAIAYQKKTGLQPQVYVCQPTNGAELVEG